MNPEPQERDWTFTMTVVVFIFGIIAMLIGGYCDHGYDPRNQ